MKVGFTGTQDGMTEAQKILVRELLIELQPEEVHHGDCIGADFDFHQIAKSLGIRVIAHPPDKDIKRTFARADELRIPKPYLERNRDIVNDTDRLIATPKSTEEELRSGTWSTVRYARRINKIVDILV